MACKRWRLDMAWYPPTVTVAAASEPVSLSEAKAHCRVDGDDDDTLLSGLIAAARGHVEAYCGTVLMSQTVAIKCDGFADFALFPIVPLSSVTSVSYVDTAGATQTLSTGVYEVRSDGLIASLALKGGQSWPDTQAGSRITVTAVVGYSTLPDPVQHAVKLLIGQWYDNRAAATEKPLIAMPNAVEALLTNHRLYSF